MTATNDVKRIKMADLHKTMDLSSLESLAEKQQYIQPRRMHLRRNIIESYRIPPGGEKIIIDQFMKRIKSGVQYFPSLKSDVFYFNMRRNYSSNIFEMNASSRIMERLSCLHLKRGQYFFLNYLKRNTVLTDKLIHWRFFYDKNCEKNISKQTYFKLNVLFSNFVNRRKEISHVILEINNKLAHIIMRAESSKYYLKKAVEIVENKN